VLADAAKQFDDAIGHYEAALDQRPDSPMLLNNLGYSHYLAGRPPEAERYFRVALSFDQKYRPAIANLGLVRARQGAYEEAVQILGSIMPEAQACNDVGYIAYQLEDYESAAFFLGEAIRLSPSYFETAHANLKRVRAAIEQRDLRATHNESRAVREYALGVIAEARGSIGEAIAHYETALQHQAGSAMLLTNLAQAHQGAGREREARKYLELAVRADPEYEPARTQLAQLNAERPDYAADYRDVMATPLNVRKHANMYARVIASLESGDRVEVLYENGDWNFIAFGDLREANPRTGWVDRQYLSAAETHNDH